jgi:tetratricopeptide (TPR) repeat protein
VPRSRAFRYKGQVIDAKKVGRQLKVRALLTGKVLQRGDVLNVQVELVDAASESQLWGERFNRKVTDIFVVEDEIARQISEKLSLKLTGHDSERLIKRNTRDTEAYYLYLKGHYHWNKRTADGLKKALEYFQQAIDQDPSYATAYAGLANGYQVLPFFAPTPPKAFFARGKAAALKAIDLDPDLSEAYTALGVLLASIDWDWAGPTTTTGSCCPPWDGTRKRYARFGAGSSSNRWQWS